MPVKYSRQILTHVPVIPNGTALSQGLNIAGFTIACLATPAAWTAAVVTFDASFDGGVTWIAVFDDAGVEVSIASATIVAAHVLVAGTLLSKLAGLPMIRLRSGPVAVPVNQGAARTFGLVLTA